MGKCFDLLSNSLDCFCKEIYKSVGEFECGYWGLKSSDQSQASLFTVKLIFW